MSFLPIPAYTYSLLMGFFLSLLCLPAVLWACRRWHLLDLPNSRKQHGSPKPALGGIAFIGATLCTLAWKGQLEQFPVGVVWALAAIGILGLLDDLFSLSALNKLVVQVSLAALTAAAGLRLNSLGGFLGLNELAPAWQYLLTLGWLVLVTNAFNLVDGVDGLAGGISLISLVVLGFFLQAHGDGAYGSFAFSLAGAVLAFLAFNVQPSRIFMGDTGSLFIGFSIGVLGLRLLQVHPQGLLALPHPMLPVAASVALPVMDALRLFCRRLRQGRSPFRPDNQHLHHLITVRGYSHRTTSILLMVLHYLIIGAAVLLRHLPFTLLLIQLLLLPLLATLLLNRLPIRTSGQFPHRES